MIAAKLFLLAFLSKLGIMQFCARVAERQTRRSQKPLSKDVRVQIPPRAPVTLKACHFVASFFIFITHALNPKTPERQSRLTGRARRNIGHRRLRGLGCLDNRPDLPLADRMRVPFRALTQVKVPSREPTAKTATRWPARTQRRSPDFSPSQ